MGEGINGINKVCFGYSFALTPIYNCIVITRMRWTIGSRLPSLSRLWDTVVITWFVIVPGCFPWGFRPLIATLSLFLVAVI